MFLNFILFNQAELKKSAILDLLQFVNTSCFFKISFHKNQTLLKLEYFRTILHRVGAPLIGYFTEEVA